MHNIIPIGIDNFREIIEYRSPLDKKQNYLYVDKTMFIHEILGDGAKAIAITRPRRFGKTINLSMLQHFFAAEVDGKPTAHLFKNLAISKHAKLMTENQGKRPVIFISLKDAKKLSFGSTVNVIKNILSRLYEEWSKTLLESPKLKDIYKDFINAVINENISTDNASLALSKLMQFVNIVTGKEVIVLIDEYDAPVQQAYISGYYTEMVDFIQTFLSTSLKDNNHLEKAVLTGILRISKESIFSDLNNVEVYSILSNQYSAHFGFLENEVNNLLEQTELMEPLSKTKEWYNGYSFGDQLLYNPWSILKFIKGKGELKPYWINTSGNKLIKELVIKGNAQLKASMAKLLADQSISEIIDEHIVFADLESNINTVWSLFLFSGYLKVISLHEKEDYDIYELKIPNKEIKHFYCSIIRNWLTEKIGMHWYQEFLSSLTAGNVEQFAKKLQELTIQSLSYHDATISNQENFYHGLVLGLVVGLKDTHDIKSNRESGYGRYDLMIIPKDKTKLGIVIEFKAVAKDSELAEAATKAYQQTIKSKYITELTGLGINNICKIGVSFSGKTVQVKGS